MTDRAIRVLVVDDSAVVRRIVIDVLTAAPDIEVVGYASNGEMAIRQITALRPDLITLDVEMPIMDGLTTLRTLRASGIRIPVIMFSTLTERGASATMDALLAGANDYVTKPANVGSVQKAIERVSEELLPKIRVLCRSLVARSSPTATSSRVSARPRPVQTSPIDVVVVAVSTGGPNALAELVPALPADLAVPVLIVQHMPPTFTRYLAERLDRHSALTVREAQGGEHPMAREVWIAPGGHHLELHRSGVDPTLRVVDSPPENSCRPAADVLFRSAAKVHGAATLAVVMTGMGQDGLAGAAAIDAAGGQIIVQDEATSVVWGMPGAVATKGLAHAIVPLGGLASAISTAVNSNRTGRPYRRALV
jgi:two-component system chemotaxis response regulator CheB